MNNQFILFFVEKQIRDSLQRVKGGFKGKFKNENIKEGLKG
jgi:hypothetical protein